MTHVEHTGPASYAGDAAPRGAAEGIAGGIGTAKDLLEVLWKVGVAVSVVCYLIGFLVANVHLGRFGSYSPSLIGADYLTAGIWALLLPASAWAIVFWFIGDMNVADRKPGRAAALAGAVLSLGAVGSSMVLLLFPEWIGGLYLPMRFVVVALAGFFATVPAIIFASWLAPLRSLELKWVPLTTVLGFLAVVAAVIYLTSFARHLYGEIPGTMGGGQPRVVRLVFRADARDDMKVAGIRFTGTSTASDPVRLLAAKEREYILALTDSSSVSVPAEVVRAVLYGAR